MPIPLDTSAVPFHSTVNNTLSSSNNKTAHQSTASLRNNVRANTSRANQSRTWTDEPAAASHSGHRDAPARRPSASTVSSTREAPPDAPTSNAAQSVSDMASPPTAHICVLPHRPGQSTSSTSHSVRLHYDTMSQPNVHRNTAVDPHARTMPVPARRVIYYRRRPRQISVTEMCAKLANEAQHNFFHANFTSGHGAYFTAPNRAQQMAYSLPYNTAGTLLMSASLAGSTTSAGAGAAARNALQHSTSRRRVLAIPAAGASSQRAKTSMPPSHTSAHHHDNESHRATASPKHPHSDGRQQQQQQQLQEQHHHHHHYHHASHATLTSPAHAPAAALLEASLSLQSGFLDAPVVTKARALSADARLTSPLRDQSSSALPVAETSYSHISQDVAQTARSPHHFTAQPLAPQTIAQTRRALRAFDVQKVHTGQPASGGHKVADTRTASSTPSSSAAGKTTRVMIRVDGHMVEIPIETPLLLMRHDTLPVVRHVGVSASHPAVVSPAIAGHYDNGDDTGTKGMEGEYVLHEKDEEVITWGAGLVDLVYLAAPATVSIACTFLMSAVPLAFIGKELGEKALTGASVGYFVTSIFILYPMIGLTFAMDTLCSHEYGRDPLSDEMGLILQRGILINLVMLSPLLVCIYGLEPILTPIYGSQIAHTASDFLYFAPLFCLPLILCVAFDKFLCNQMQPHISTISLVASTLLMPLIQLKLTPMGVRYTMLGMAITAWVQLTVVIVITLFNPYTRTTLGALRLREVLKTGGIRDYMRLAVPSAVFVCAESASFDFSVLLCARFDTTEGAAWSCIQNLLFVFSSFSGGLSTSVCANVGRCIGANEPQSARRFAVLAVITAFCVGVVNSAVVVVFFDFFMSLFGVNGRTFDIARRLIYLLPIFHTADSVQFTFQGIFSGLGKNNLGAVILLLSLWGVGIPLAIVLGSWLHWRTWGVCLGLIAGLCIEAPAMIWSAASIDFQSVCDDFLAQEQFEAMIIEDDDELGSVDSNDAHGGPGTTRHVLSKYPSLIHALHAQEEAGETYVQKIIRRLGLAQRRTSLTSNNAAHEYTTLLPEHDTHPASP